MQQQSSQSNLQQWLKSIHCLQFFTQNDILNGILIYKIIDQIFSNSQSKSLKQLSTSTSTLSRVSNWNILVEELKKISIILNQQNKNKIVNGNQQSVIEIISQLKDYHQKKQKSSEVDIAQIDPKKDPNDSASLLQLLLVLLTKHFHLSAKQSVALLSNQSKYLAHILTKGLRGQFKSIEIFIGQLGKHQKKIVEFCKGNEQNITFLLRSIKPALISKSETVSMMCLIFFNQFFLHFHINQRINIFQTHLQSTYILTIKRHPHMEADIISSVLNGIVSPHIEKSKYNQTKQTNQQFQLTPEQTNKIRTKILQDLFGQINGISEQYSLILAILKVFAELNKLPQCLKIEYFSKMIMKSVEAIKDEQHSLVCISIVLTLCQHLPQLFQQQNQMQIQPQYFLQPQKLAEVLLQNLRSLLFPSNPIPFAMQLFTLLYYFGREKNAIAPSIYKLVIERFSEIQNVHSDIYQVYIQGFTQLIKDFPSIPWISVLDLILARKKSSQEESELSEVQLEFFQFLLEVQGMDIKSALGIYDLISKSFIQTYHFAGFITKIIVKIVNMYSKTEQIVKELTVKFIKVCLAIHHANVKKLSHKRKPLAGNIKLSDEQTLSKIKNNAVQFLILKLCQIQNLQINSKVEPLVAFSYIQMKEKPEFSKGFKSILMILGNINSILEKYQNQIKKAEQQAQELQKNSKSNLSSEKEKQKDKEKIASKITSKIHSKSRYQSQNTVSAHEQQLINSDNLTNLPKGKSISFQSSTFGRSYLGVTPSAQKGIEKFQKVYLSKIQKHDFEKIRKQQDEERLEIMKKLYRKKMMSNGIEMKGQTDNIQYLFEFDSQENIILEKHFLKVSYYSAENEEERDMMAVQKLLKSYQKALRLVYSIYSGQKRGQQPQNFDQIAEKSTAISSTNLYKLLKDFGFQDYVSLKQVQYLTQKINAERNTQTSDYQIIDFDGFIEFIKQVSFLMFTRPPKDLRGHPLTMMLQQTFSNLKLFAGQNKINEQMFEDPANIFFNQTQAIAQLNKKLVKNPDYILPEGYKKLIEKKISFQYGIFLEAINPTYKVVLEVIDWLMNKGIGFHLIEPFTKEQKIFKARPSLFVTERLKIDVMPASHIPTSMKKEITKIPIKSRPIAKQCAIVLDQIVTAIQLGHNDLGQRHFNKIQIQRKKLVQQEQKQLQIQKRKRQSRNRQAKTAIEQYNIKKQQKDKEMSQKKYQEEKKLKQEKQRKDKEEKQLKKKVQQYTKKKKQEEEEKLKKKNYLDEKEKRDREKLKLLNEETKRKIQQEKKKKDEEQSAKKTQKLQDEKKTKELQKIKMQQSQLMKKKLIEQFKLKKSQLGSNFQASQSYPLQRKSIQGFNDACQDKIE